MRVDEHNRELQKGTFNTPVQKRVVSSAPSARRMLQDEKVKNLKFRGEVASRDVYVVKESTLNQCDIDYVLEAIAQIIAARVKSGSIDLWTPYGDCTLHYISSGNFFVKVKNIRTRYSNLLPALEKCKNNGIIKENIINFLCARVDDQFCIDTSANRLEIQIRTCLKKYNKVKFVDNPVAAAICGIFVSEMIRVCGKAVRAAFRTSWPRTYKELQDRFVLASEGGARLLRQYLENPESVPPKVAAAAEANVNLFSPAKKRRKME